nr:immunoglobulin heavy chain junction region [Macaca mulatta]
CVRDFYSSGWTRAYGFTDCW